MRVSRLVLKNFRNYSGLSWRPHPFVNILSGNNAQGKTNLLEAIFFCTAGRSFRTGREREIIGWPGGECSAGAELEGKGSTFEVSARLSEGGRTTFFLNGKKQARGKIFHPCMSVAFTPADLEMVGGTPSERRKWIDQELGPFDIRYPHALEQFEKVLAQRNNLLKGPGRRKDLEVLTDPWNEQLFEYGSVIINSRIRLLKELFPHLREVYHVLTAGNEEISFNYLSSLPLEKGMGPEDIRRIYRETVGRRFVQEAERQQTLFGPHRDDLAFFINGADVRKFGSRGQQRSVVLALKLAIMKLFYCEYREYPVLLLDDVFLELDRQRQKGLEDLLHGEAQVFITTDRRPGEITGGRTGNFTVDKGKIDGGEE